MARKSRKEKKRASLPTNKLEKDRVGGYIRLSIKDNGDKERDSIANQTAYVQEFIENKDDLKLEKIYQDNGSTGTNFERFGWNELIGDIKNRKITCIVVKDFSRLGRNYIEVGNYLEKVFPLLGIRVIAINDNFDSKIHQFNEKMLISSLINIINEYYAKDISRKITQTHRMKQNNGELSCSIYPYGYVRCKNNPKKLAIDIECAKVVKKIFEWRKNGIEYLMIARYLNELLIPSPGLYRYLNGDLRFKRSSNTKWKSKHIAGILTNPVYLGHLIQGKTRTSYFETEGKVKILPKKEWRIVENTHEALVSQYVFDIVQRIEQKSKKCNQQIIEINPCILKKENPNRNCSNTIHIGEEILFKAVKAILEKQIKLFYGISIKWDKISKNKQFHSDVETRKSNIANLQNKIEFLKKRKNQLYDDIKAGTLSINEYNYTKNKYNQEINKLQYSLEVRKFIGAVPNGYQEQIIQYLDFDIAKKLVEKVTVYFAERIVLKVTYTDEVAK